MRRRGSLSLTPDLTYPVRRVLQGCISFLVVRWRGSGEEFEFSSTRSARTIPRSAHWLSSSISTPRRFSPGCARSVSFVSWSSARENDRRTSVCWGQDRERERDAWALSTLAVYSWFSTELWDTNGDEWSMSCAGLSGSDIDRWHNVDREGRVQVGDLASRDHANREVSQRKPDVRWTSLVDWSTRRARSSTMIVP